MNTTGRTLTQASFWLAIFLVMISLPAQVSAQNQPPSDRGPISFATFDADGNGEVDPAEFNQALGERMAANAAEGRPMKNAANVPDFERVDSDGNGSLNESEVLAFQSEQRATNQGQGVGQGMNQGKCKGQGQGQGQGQGIGMNNNMKMPSFSEIDADGNGCISPDEFTAHQKAMHP